MTDLKLLALDTEDLAVISAHVQDAVVRVEDMGYAREDKRFALLINRYAWEKDGKSKTGERKRAALRFDFVTNAQSANINLHAREGVLELLSVTFEMTDDPSGEVLLSFAGGGTVRLSVECLEVRLHDLGAAWAASARPEHDLSDVTEIDSSKA